MAKQQISRLQRETEPKEKGKLKTHRPQVKETKREEETERKKGQQKKGA